MTDELALQRFVDAQAPVYDTVVEELRAGQKRTHFMWFIFPQLAGLGHSAMAERYAITSRAEAVAYLAHALLGPRLRECSALVAATPGRSVAEIFGSPDDLKLRSSMTLFSRAAPDEPVFAACLQAHFDGQPDPRTLALLQACSARG